MRTTLRGLALLFVLTACKEPTPSPVGPAPPLEVSKTSSTSVAAKRRYDEVLTLIRLDPQDLTRAERLYPLVLPLCSGRAERAAFLEAAAQAAGGTGDLGKLERIYALDIVEHVALACARNDVAAGQAVLSEAAARFPGEARLPSIEARMLAADGQLAPALDAAKRAAQAGSIVAIPLLATIQAQRAKEGVEGLPPGTLDEALQTVSVEPDGAWRLIDLTALLSTRARLLGERAVWEDGPAARGTLLAAREVHRRLAAPPFIEVTRQHALDVGCFDAASLDDASVDFCPRAAAAHGNLGAAFLAGVGLDPARFDLARVAAIQAFEARLAELPAGARLLLVARGDEAELIPWARPAALVLGRLAAKRPRLVVLDRSTGRRAGALVDRIVALAKLEPAIRIEAERDILATPCVAARLAGKAATASCPLDAAALAELARPAPAAVALLVGRDLDAELEDLREQGVPHALLSMRKTATEHDADVQLKSLSDAWLLAPAAAKRAGSQRPR